MDILLNIAFWVVGIVLIILVAGCFFGCALIFSSIMKEMEKMDQNHYKRKKKP